MKFKTGLVHMPELPKLRFGTYFQPDILPTLPPTFGHQGIYPPRGWGMLGNDKIGDCTVAGAMHATMVWHKVINKEVAFTNLDAWDDYFAITGGQDTGVDMLVQAQYWQKTGFRDSTATRHKILAYMSVDPTNFAHIDAACYLFEAVGLGVRVGDEEEQMFEDGQPWANPSSPANAYHYVPMVGKNSLYRHVITWGGEQDITDGWLAAKCDEVVAVLTNENLIAGKSFEGFDIDALTADLESLGA